MNNKIVVIGRDHHNTLGVVNSLARKGLMSYTIVLDHRIRNSYVAESKYVIQGWICPSDNEVVNCLFSNLKGEDSQKTVIITTSDDAATILDNNYNALSPYFYMPGCRGQGLLTPQMSKQAMAKLATEVGLNVPRTILVENNKIDYTQVVYPCITKAISSIEGGKSDIKICQKEEELKDFIENQKHCERIQVQKFVNKAFEFQFLGCSLNGGEYIYIPGRTNIDRPKGFDNTYYLEFMPVDSSFEKTLDACKTFIKRTGYSGTFSVEFLRDKDGIDYFLEMNFRNDGNAICATESGANLPYIWYLYHTGGDFQSEIKNSAIHKVSLMPELYCFNRMIVGEMGWSEYWSKVKSATCLTTRFKDDLRPFRMYFWYRKVEFAKGLIRDILLRLKLYKK